MGLVKEFKREILREFEKINEKSVEESAQIMLIRISGKIQEEAIVITVSKLVKNDETTRDIVDTETLVALASVAEELLGQGVVVEVSKA
jgi:hypothetical protein